MSKKVTIHENEYSKLKFNRQKKPRWLQDDNPSVFFHTFTQKPPKEKDIDIAEKKLAEIDLNLDILDQKYEGVQDSILYLCDTQGRSLWMNHFLHDLMFRDVKDIYMKPHFYDFVNMNHEKPHVQNELRKMMKELPKKHELYDNLQTSVGELYLKLLYERVDDKNGKPFGYFVTGKSFSTRENKSSTAKKLKSKKEEVQERLKESGLDESIFSEYQKSEKQVIMVDLLGRMLWMNKQFAFVNFKTEQDLMEGLYNEFGFEVFIKSYEYVTKNLPMNYTSSDIEFKRVDTKIGKALGYIVVFHTLSQIPTDRSAKDIANETLARVGFSCEILEEMYGKSPNLHSIVTLNGRLVWMNETHCKISKRTLEKDIMAPGISLLLRANQTNEFLVENMTNFLTSKGDVLQFGAQIKISNGGEGNAKFTLTRIDSKEGTPFLYHTEIASNSVEE